MRDYYENYDGMSREEILMHAATKHGFDEPGPGCHPNTARRLVRLLCEGCVERRERTVEVPGFDMPESCKKVSMFDTWSPRTVHLVTYHLVRYPEK